MSANDREARLTDAIDAAWWAIVEVVQAWHDMTDDEVFAWRQRLPRGEDEPAPDVLLPILLMACGLIDDARAWRTLDDARNYYGDEDGFNAREFWHTTLAMVEHEAARQKAEGPSWEADEEMPF